MADEEKAWLEQAIQGDKAAFGQLVNVYYRPVRSIVGRRLGYSNNYAAEIEEVVQDVFVKAYMRLDTYNPQMKFRNWIFSIASNHCIDLMRRKRLQTVYLEDWSESGETFLFQGRAEPSPEMVLLEQEHQYWVESLVRRLPPLERDVILLRYWDELSIENIAQLLNTTASAVKTRLSRTRKRLAMMSLIEPQPSAYTSAAFGD